MLGAGWKEWHSRDEFDRAKLTYIHKDKMIVGEIWKIGAVFKCQILIYEYKESVYQVERQISFNETTERFAKNKIETMIVNIIH